MIIFGNYFWLPNCVMLNILNANVFLIETCCFLELFEELDTRWRQCLDV